MSARLTANEVVEIRTKYAGAGQPTYTELAQEYGKSTSTIASVVRGLTYRDAGGPITENPTRGRKKGKSPAKAAKNCPDCDPCDCDE